MEFLTNPFILYQVGLFSFLAMILMIKIFWIRLQEDKEVSTNSELAEEALIKYALTGNRNDIIQIEKKITPKQILNIAINIDLKHLEKLQELYIQKGFYQQDLNGLKQKKRDKIKSLRRLAIIKIAKAHPKLMSILENEEDTNILNQIYICLAAINFQGKQSFLSKILWEKSLPFLVQEYLQKALEKLKNHSFSNKENSHFQQNEIPWDIILFKLKSKKYYGISDYITKANYLKIKIPNEVLFNIYYSKRESLRVLAIDSLTQGIRYDARIVQLYQNIPTIYAQDKMGSKEKKWNY